MKGNSVNLKLKTPYVLSAVIAALMAVQAIVGRLLESQYRDVAWVKLTWVGNDLVTLLLAVPLLILGVALARRGSARGTVLWLGMLGYCIYNYAFYLLGTALNVFFPLYVLLAVLSVVTMVLALTRVDAAALSASLREKAPVRAIGGYLIFVAVGLATVELGVWAAYAFAGRPTPVEPEAFKLVAALDTSIMVPALAFGGVLLWRRSIWGVVVAGIAGVQASLYLLVLALNSTNAIRLGTIASPGELPIWGPLFVGTTVATTAFMWSLRPNRSSK